MDRTIDLPGSFVAFNAYLPTPLERGQLVLARHAFDGVHPQDPRLSLEDRELATAMFGTWPDEISDHARRKIELVLGRDSGKSELAIRFGLYQALTVDLSSVGRGDTAHFIFIAPDLELARIMIARTVALIESTPSLKSRLVGATSREAFSISRADGRVVRFVARAAARGGRTGRGIPILGAVLDEVAFHLGEGFVVNDEEIVKALTPRLIGKILLLSTPWANEGLFHRLFVKNFGAPIDAVVARAPTLLMRDEDPIRSAMIASEYETDPDNAAREFGAEFLEIGTTSFFDGLALTAAVADVDALRESRAAASHKSAGADLALVRDSSALAIVEALHVGPDGEDLDRPTFVLAETLERRPQKGSPLRLGDVVADFAAVLKRHDLERFMTDGHEREAAREHAEKHGIGIESAPEGQRGKAESYLFVRDLFNEGRLLIPDDPRLLSQLRAIRSQPMPGGGLKITSPRRSGHGDRVSALVLAAWSADQSAPITEYIPYCEPSRFGDQRGF